MHVNRQILDTAEFELVGVLTTRTTSTRGTRQNARSGGYVQSVHSALGNRAGS